MANGKEKTTRIKSNIDFKKFKKIIQAMSKEYKVTVGIHQEQNEDKGDNIDIAGIGAVQEFGATINVTEKMRAYLHYTGLHLKPETTQITIPARSFLQMPLEEHSKELVKNVKSHFGGDQDSVEYYIQEKGDLMSIAVILGQEAVNLINEAFETSGFGKWQPLNSYTIERRTNESSLPLLDTGDLRSRINFKVEQNG